MLKAKYWYTSLSLNTIKQTVNCDNSQYPYNFYSSINPALRIGGFYGNPEYFVFVLSLAMAGQDVGSLSPNHPIEREIASGETHSHQIILAQGQYLAAIPVRRAL